MWLDTKIIKIVVVINVWLDLPYGFSIELQIYSAIYWSVTKIQWIFVGNIKYITHNYIQRIFSIAFFLTTIKDSLAPGSR